MAEESKRPTESFEEWYPDFIKETKEKWGDLSTDMMLKHVANMSFIEGYFKAKIEEVES